MLLILGNRDTTCEGALFFGGEMLCDVCEELHGAAGFDLLGRTAAGLARITGEAIVREWVDARSYLARLGYIIEDHQLKAIRQAWCAETALGEDWSEATPSKNQCAVTALIVNDLTGRPVIRGKAHLPDGRIDSHYWNQGLDLTMDQYPEGTVRVATGGLQGAAARDYLLSSADVRDRYERLKLRYAGALFASWGGARIEDTRRADDTAPAPND